MVDVAIELLSPRVSDFERVDEDEIQFREFISTVPESRSLESGSAILTSIDDDDEL